MNKKVVNFSPKNQFYNDIMSGKKCQTIRDKPIEPGIVIRAWENRRGMARGRYCLKCFEPVSRVIIDNSDSEVHIDPDIQCDGKSAIFPRFLGEYKIKECIPILIRWEETDKVMDIKLSAKDVISIEYENERSDEFVSKDTPSWTSKRFIDFFLNTYPDIKKDWKQFYIWKW